MEKVVAPPFTHVLKNYCLLVKPGILFGNVLTAAAGFVLSSHSSVDLWLFFAMAIGLSCLMASGCVFNHYIDRDKDAKMSRTQSRPLVIGAVSTKNALRFAIVLCFLGILFLSLWTPFLTVAIALFGFIVYVILYSLSKSISVYGTWVGSIAGAVPPVVGYSATHHGLDLGAFLLFAMLVTWQIPHFFAIAIYRLADYAKANIPVLPLKKGVFITQLHMLFSITVFIGLSVLLTLFQYTGSIYLIIATFLGFSWLGLCLAGFKRKNPQQWARQMFVFSLIVIIGICAIILCMN